MSCINHLYWVCLSSRNPRSHQNFSHFRKTLVFQVFGNVRLLETRTFLMEFFGKSHTLLTHTTGSKVMDGSKSGVRKTRSGLSTPTIRLSTPDVSRPVNRFYIKIEILPVSDYRRVNRIFCLGVIIHQHT